MQRYLTRSALTSDEPSDFSKNELRRYELLELYDEEPRRRAGQAARRGAARAGFPHDALFALAELWFLRADDDEQQSSYAASLDLRLRISVSRDQEPHARSARPARTRSRPTSTTARSPAPSSARRRARSRSTAAACSICPSGSSSSSSRPTSLHVNGERALRPAAGRRARGEGHQEPLSPAGHRRAARREDAAASGRRSGDLPSRGLARQPVTAVVLIDAPLAGLRARRAARSARA